MGELDTILEQCRQEMEEITASRVASDNVVATFPPDTHLQVSWVQGQFVRGSDWWAHLTHSELGFIHASALQEVRW